MKRVVLIVCCLIMLTSCLQKNDQSFKETIIATVITDSNLLYDEESIGLFTMNYDTTFEIGDVLEIEFSGMVAESYPAQIGKPFKVTLLRKEENSIVLIMKLLRETIDSDSLLTRNLKEISLDVQGVTSGEINVVHYLVSSWFNQQEVIVQNHNDLVISKKIDADFNYVNGLLIKVVLSLRSDHGYDFEIDLYHSVNEKKVVRGWAEFINGVYAISYE